MNNNIFFLFYSLAHQSAWMDKMAIFLAVYLPFGVVILMGLFLLFHHDILHAENPFQVFLQKRKEILKVFFAGALAWAVANLIKIIFATPRPFDLFPQVVSLVPETGYAFPSAHATFFMALAVSIFTLHKKASYIFMFFAVLIGIGRMIVGVHFPVDILGGFLIGALIAYLLRKL